MCMPNIFFSSSTWCSDRFSFTYARTPSTSGESTVGAGGGRRGLCFADGGAASVADSEELPEPGDEPSLRLDVRVGSLVDVVDAAAFRGVSRRLAPGGESGASPSDCRCAWLARIVSWRCSSYADSDMNFWTAVCSPPPHPQSSRATSSATM